MQAPQFYTEICPYRERLFAGFRVTQCPHFDLVGLGCCHHAAVGGPKTLLVGVLQVSIAFVDAEIHAAGDCNERSHKRRTVSTTTRGRRFHNQQARTPTNTHAPDIDSATAAIATKQKRSRNTLLGHTHSRTLGYHAGVLSDWQPNLAPGHELNVTRCNLSFDHHMRSNSKLRNMRLQNPPVCA